MRVTWVPTLLAAVFLLAAGLLCAALGLGYDHWLAVANAASAKGDASNYLTPAVWTAITAKAIGTAAAMVLLAGLILWRRMAMIRLLEFVTRDARQFRAELAAWLRRIWGEDGPSTWATAALLTIGGIWVRWRDLDQPLRHDEALVFLNFVRRPLYLLVAMYNDVANHVFETVLKHESWLLFGDAEWSIRLPVFLAGCLLTPLLYLVVRASYGALPALMAAALAAGSSVLIEYSVNARGYEFLALWIVVLIGLRHVLVRRDNSFVWLLWALASGLIFWTNPSAILSYGVVACWLLIGLALRPKQSRLKGIFWLIAMCGLGMVLTILLYSPILISSGLGHMSHMVARGASDLRLDDPLDRLAELGQAYSRNLPLWLALIFGATALLGAALDHWRNGRTGPLFLAVVLWLGAYLVLFPVFGFVRLWLPYAVFAYLLAAIGLGWLVERLAGAWRRPVGLAVALLIGLAGIGGEALSDFIRKNPDGAFFESRQVAVDFASRLQPGDVVFAPCPGTMPLTYGLMRLGVQTRIMTSEPMAANIDTIQVFTLASTQANPLPWHPSGAMYVILTDTLAPLETQWRTLFPNSPLESAVINRYPHSTVYRVSVPMGLVLR